MNLRHLFVLVSALFLFTACENAPTTPRYLPYTIGQSDPIDMNVANVEFIDQYKPPFVPPNVEHTFAIKPYDAVHKLVEDRIQKSPMSNATLKVTIVDASVVEESLKTTPGLQGAFTNDQSEKYKGKIEVLFEIYEPGFMLPRAKFNVKLDRSGTIDERASYKDRQDFFYDFTKGMIEQLNTQMGEGINRYFTDYNGSKMPAVQVAPNPPVNSVVVQPNNSPIIQKELPAKLPN